MNVLIGTLLYVGLLIDVGLGFMGFTYLLSLLSRVEGYTNQKKFVVGVYLFFVLTLFLVLMASVVHFGSQQPSTGLTYGQPFSLIP